MGTEAQPVSAAEGSLSGENAQTRLWATFWSVECARGEMF